MLAEPHPAPLVRSLTVPGAFQKPQGYYRSKLFIASFATNPLAAAAGPLLSLLERLCISPTLPPVATIRENIEHELQAFLSRLNSQRYAEELISIAHYLLCATIDELLGKSYLRLYGRVSEFKAFSPSSTHDIGPQKRFFDIVQHLKESPTQYLDLLELTYYCLIAGFEGDFHLRPDGRQQLDNLIEELFQLIQKHRVNKPHRLFKEPSTQVTAPSNYKPFITVTLTTLVVFCAVFWGSHTYLEHKAKKVVGLTKLVKMEY